ncbi:hypothetical protein C4D60_Mb11t10370 [Musa balbisiana]|uniref:Uncharacterized protein n=1 Tax=Musa balbisiana TaxID=52838 RepID=A0A4V6T499_MUSBA|nr:hypothetical protein C4D60_Mb11t10370 [Musa balbisiana]
MDQIKYILDLVFQTSSFQLLTYVSRMWLEHILSSIKGRAISSIINLEEGTPIEFQGGRSPKEINPKLRICKGSTWYQSSVLGVSLLFYSHLSALHSRLKQFPQLLKRSSLNFTVISTIANHPLISSSKTFIHSPKTPPNHTLKLYPKQA